MSLRTLPRIAALAPPKGVDWSPPSQAEARWLERPLAVADDAADVSILECIGQGWFGDGFTARKMAAILRSLGDRPVSVAINSPGGDVFEGVAIYNLLAAHPAEVTVKVLGVAASSASVIAMAGDRIEIGVGALLMIHNCWGAVIGDRNDLRDAIETFGKIDAAMASIYVARSGLDAKSVGAMMDAETWLDGASAVEQGFADAVGEPVAPATQAAARLPAQAAARRRIESLLAQHGVPRSERRALLRDATGARDAAGQATPGAGFTAEAQRLLAQLNS